MKKLSAAVAALALLVVGAAFAQSGITYTNVATQVSVGDFSDVTFTFGHGVNGQPGTTRLVIQCLFHRAELITNFDVYGEQMTSAFFAVTCGDTGPHAFVLNATPLHESLVMTGRNSQGQTVTQDLNLVVPMADWQVVGEIGPYCFNTDKCKAVGTALVTY